LRAKKKNEATELTLSLIQWPPFVLCLLNHISITTIPRERDIVTFSLNLKLRELKGISPRSQRSPISTLL
jgi:hypothetical protein